jgi:shikimate dehydrogenase
MSAHPPDRYAVIGHPVAHSQSPFIHAEFARQTGHPIAYERVLSPLDGFESTLAWWAASGARGCNVAAVGGGPERTGAVGPSGQHGSL